MLDFHSCDIFNPCLEKKNTKKKTKQNNTKTAKKTKQNKTNKY